jgi:hypothetical protein
MQLVSASGSDDDNDIVTAAKIAKRYKVTPTTVYRWADTDKIPSLKFEGIVRFSLSKVRRIIEGDDYSPE